MNPIYKFTLSANGGAERPVFPIFRDDLAKDFELQSNQEFFRAKLSGKLTFVADDYDFIATKAFDTQFGVKIYISYDAGTTWTQYWAGNFWKTDCTFNGNNKSVTVTPDVVDQYNAVLSGLEKEYNLIELAPVIQFVKIDKRPMIQVYIPGTNAIGCFLSGMWWEQECEPISESDLTSLFYFRENKEFNVLTITQQTTTPWMPVVLPPVFAAQSTGFSFDISNGGYTFRLDGNTAEYQIIRESDNTMLWRGFSSPLQGIAGTDADGTEVYFDEDITRIYARVVTDVTSGTYPIPDNDPISDNRNYTRVAPYYEPDTIGVSDRMQADPTEWGIYQPGLYYLPPLSDGWFPVGRSSWGRASYWFNANTATQSFDESSFSAPYTLRDAFPLWSVISVLLGKIAPGVTHQATTDYSAFLYGENPITGITQTLMITPKSNVIYAGYDQPAQKAPITLKAVLDMLRDCFRCYWFIDADNRFRIEHISYFQKGGSYTDDPEIGINLTEQVVTRNGKPWAFGSEEYQFDKPEMTARYQFGWMDDVTQFFEGFPIEILSQFVTPNKIENIDISKFTSDIDYILLNPGEINKEGFVLLSASLINGEYKLPYLEYVTDESTHYLQNGYVSFVYLQRYYLYDLPGPDYSINGVAGVALGTKKLKTQTIKFPVLTDPDLLRLVKTNIGDGKIQKMSINLSSRNANTTLKYDTE